MILSKHREEWEKSNVDEKIINYNVLSLSGIDIYDYIFINHNLKIRRNDGRLRDSFLKRYQHCELGGWWCRGIDVLTGETSKWGQYKPDFPREDFDNLENIGKKKIIKYESPKDVPTEIYALSIPLHIWINIASRYNIPLPNNILTTDNEKPIGFWDWVIKNPQIPILITEGAKKAGVLLSNNYAAIALPGIFNGYRQKRDIYGNKIGVSQLIPQLKIFAQENREIIFCYDNDIKPQTKANIRIATVKTGKLFSLEKSQVSIVEWDQPHKGVDDLIATEGIESFNAAFKKRKSLDRYNIDFHLDYSQFNPIQINHRYIPSNLIPPQSAQLIGIKSNKGTGKTEWLSNIIKELIRDGKPVLLITHRIQLTKSLCRRFGIEHIEEIKTSSIGGVLGYGLCVDSLHEKSQAKFNPQDWNEATIILDECEQTIWHMLNSSTCQDNRISIINNFQKLLNIVVQSGGKIFVSDADLSGICLNYISKLLGNFVNTWVIENTYRPSIKRKAYNYSGKDPIELITCLIKSISKGEKVLIHTTGQKAKSKWGAINLESYLKCLFSHLKILRIDRDSVSEPGHEAFRCVDNINDVVQQYDIVICSPIIETGVSIDLKNHFNSVWIIAQGIQTVDAVSQTVERLRDDVPRHIWAKTTAKANRLGNGAISVKGLLASQNALARSNILLLQQAGVDDLIDIDINFSPQSFLTWAKRACIINAGKNNYRKEIIDKLAFEGYTIIDVEKEKTENLTLINDQLELTRQFNYQKYCEGVALAKLPTKAELNQLIRKRTKTEEERLMEQKGKLTILYGMEVTPEIVTKNDNDWYPKLQLHYYLSIGRQYLIEKDKRSLDQLVNISSRTISSECKKTADINIASEQSLLPYMSLKSAFKPDINKKQLLTKIKTLEFIGIQQFFNSCSEFTKDSLKQWYEEISLFRYDIKTILGVSINPHKDSPISVAQRILKIIGLKLEFKHQVRIKGKPTRIYKGCNGNPDGRSQVFSNWVDRDTHECHTLH